jgi:hypothetical protein
MATPGLTTECPVSMSRHERLSYALDRLQFFFFNLPRYYSDLFCRPCARHQHVHGDAAPGRPLRLHRPHRRRTGSQLLQRHRDVLQHPVEGWTRELIASQFREKDDCSCFATRALCMVGGQFTACGRDPAIGTR